MVVDLLLRAMVASQVFKAQIEDDRGQALAEYGLIMAVIAVAVVTLAGIWFRDAIIGAFNGAISCFDGTC